MQKRRHLTHRTSPYQLRKMQATQYEKEQENYVQYEGDKTQEPRQVDYFEDVANYILVNPENETGEVEDPTMEQPEQEWTYAPAQIIKAPVQPYDPHDDISDKYRWRPGFCLQLGSQGRKAMLQLLRNVYKGDKRHKQILENMNPPTTISNLPFFKVSMLWELAYHLDVFEEALAIHKIYAKMKNKVYRNHHHFSRPYYDYELHKMHNTRSSRPRGIPNALYGQEYEGGKSEDQRQHAVMQKKNMDQLKRNMECLIAVKKAGPEQFIKFMSSFKQRTEACPPPPPPVMNKELDPNNQNQGEEHYDYTPQIASSALDKRSEKPRFAVCLKKRPRFRNNSRAIVTNKWKRNPKYSIIFKCCKKDKMPSDCIAECPPCGYRSRGRSGYTVRQNGLCRGRSQ